MQSLLDRMAELQTELDAADATAVERKVDKVLGAMGFTPADAALPVSTYTSRQLRLFAISSCISTS